MDPSGRTTQEEAEEAPTRAAAAHQALVHRNRRREVEECNLEGVEGRAGCHSYNLRAAGAGRTVGEGQDRTVRHKELEPEVARTRTAE